MRKIISKKDRKNFLKISLFILFVYITMFGISLAVAIINYFISKYENGSGRGWKVIALILSTVHSLLIVVNWFAIKIQKGRIDYVKSSTFAWLISILMDFMSTISMVCNTITALINGDVLNTQSLWLLPLMSFLTAGISFFNFVFAVYFVLVARKSVKINETI